MKYVIASANGYGNAGDDICAISCARIIKQSDTEAEITITQPPFNEAAVKDAGAIVLGGGGIIYDANKDNVENYLNYIEYGLAHNKKVVALGVGEQGIVTKTGAARYAEVLSQIDLLTVRSQLDAKRFSAIDVKGAKATQDLAFSYDYRRFKIWAQLTQFVRNLQPRQRPKLGVVISNQEHLVNDLKLAFSRAEKENALHFKNSLAAHMKDIAKHYRVTLIVQSRDDIELASEYAQKLNLKIYIYKTAADLKKLLTVYARQDLILTQRFHGIIFSLQLGLPVIALGYYGQKQFKLLTDLGLEDKLLMYHQPALIEDLLENLSSPHKSPLKFVIYPSEGLHKKIEISQKQNTALLQQLINNL